MKVLNFGSLNLDFVYQVAHMVTPGETLASDALQVFCGGKGLNQSLALAKAGVEVFHAGCIGADGAVLRQVLEDAGVNTDLIKVLPVQTGHAMIQVDRNGQNCILLYGGANRAMTETYIDTVLETFGKGDILLLQNEINCLAYLIDQAYAKGMTIMLNPSPFDEHLHDCDLHKISLFLLNEVEGAQLTGKRAPAEVLQAMHQLYPKAETVLTLGGDGACYQAGQAVYVQEIYPVEALDTTAAGDTFTGYFIAGMLETSDATFALDLAAKAAAIAVSRKGAAPSIPTRQEVVAWAGC